MRNDMFPKPRVAELGLSFCEEALNKIALGVNQLTGAVVGITRCDQQCLRSLHQKVAPEEPKWNREGNDK